MELSDFKKLTQEQKIQAIIDNDNSIYLSHRIVAGVTIHLYYYKGIFIELSFSKKNSKDAIINAFKGSAPLDYYLPAIDIGGIIQVL